MSELLFQNTFILRKPRVANFADMIKIATVTINPTKAGGATSTPTFFEDTYLSNA